MLDENIHLFTLRWLCHSIKPCHLATIPRRHGLSRVLWPISHPCRWLKVDISEVILDSKFRQLNHSRRNYCIRISSTNISYQGSTYDCEESCCIGFVIDKQLVSSQENWHQCVFLPYCPSLDLDLLLSCLSGVPVLPRY